VRERVHVKLTKNGNSNTVAIPQPFRHALGILQGDLLDVELFRDSRAIVIRKVDTRDVRRTPVEQAAALPKGAQR